MNKPPIFLRTNLFITDTGFIVYWVITAFGILPSSWLFKDYHNPIMTVWNWSFAPLDLSASIIGLLALYLARNGKTLWQPLAIVSITLTFCAGLMAIAFWTLRFDFDIWWWAPNLYLFVWPIFGILRLLRIKH